MAKEEIVAAIDFGTTFSGYAYSWKHEYDKDHLKLHANTTWAEGGATLLSTKTPTTILFDKDDKFDSFGYQAETKYAELAEAEVHIGWRYFRRFKMKLQTRELQNLRGDMKIVDDQGKKMRAITVFGESIKYLKNHLLNHLRTKDNTLQEKDIYWVLTVPAIWQEGAKQFMSKAAEYAGIKSDRMTLALEPEAAAVYCKEDDAKKSQEAATEKGTFSEGTQFVVVDLGGGTADYTAHEIQPDGTLSEITTPSGGPWGGILVDKEFETFIKNICSEEVLKEVSEKYKNDYLDLFTVFEVKKREAQTSSGKVIMKIPSTFPDVVKEKLAKTLSERLEASAFSKTVTKKRDRIFMEQCVFKSFFKTAQEHNIEHLRNLLSRQELRKVKTIVIVGGFSESPYMSKAVMEAFGRDYEVIIPEDTGLAVVKGAVLIGRNPSAIATRKMRFTYGISTSRPFEPTRHDVRHKSTSRMGHECCEDIFLAFIQKGTDALPGRTIKEHFVYATSSQPTIEVYKSTNTSPEYVDDEDCSLLGVIKMTVEDMDMYERREVKVTMIFGRAQLEVRAEDVRTRRSVATTFNML